jgi:peptide/nickel transport system permease protein
MLRYIALRLLRALATLFVAVSATFLLLRLLPGDPVSAMVHPGTPPEIQARLLADFGLDRPLWAQYVAYLSQLAQGNLGQSFRQAAPVTRILMEHLPWTVILMGTALVVTLLVAIPLGIVAAVRRGSRADRTIQMIGILGNSLFVPSVAILLLYVGAFQLGWFPIGGAIDPDATGLAAYGSLVHHLTLPVLGLVLLQLGQFVLVLRTNLAEALGEDYVRLARGMGVAERRVVLVHALRNALLPTVTLIGVQAGLLVGGAVLTETIFAYPGVGRLIYESVTELDFPILQGAFILLAGTVIVANLIADLAYAVLNPLVRSL